jgi:hypothetical protein
VLEALRRRAGQFGLDIILVDVWEGSEAAVEARQYCKMWGIEATVLLDETAAYARMLGVRGVPTDVFVDERGMVRAVGATGAQELLREATRLAPGLKDEHELGHGMGQLPAGFGAGAEEPDSPPPSR